MYVLVTGEWFLSVNVLMQPPLFKGRQDPKSAMRRCIRTGFELKRVELGVLAAVKLERLQHFDVPAGVVGLARDLVQKDWRARPRMAFHMAWGLLGHDLGLTGGGLWADRGMNLG